MKTGVSGHLLDELLILEDLPLFKPYLGGLFGRKASGTQNACVALGELSQRLNHLGVIFEFLFEVSRTTMAPTASWLGALALSNLLR